MTAGLIAPFEQLLAEGFRVINVGADVVGMSSYIKQRLELIEDHIAKLPSGLKPARRAPYG